MLNERSINQNDVEHSFPYKLWRCLQWAGSDQEKMVNLGAGWLSESKFFIQKNRFCQIFKMQINTFNFKLRTFKFTQYKQRQNLYTFWECEGFTKKSSISDLSYIYFRRRLDSTLPPVSELAIYIPLLYSIQLFTAEQESPQFFMKFKSDSILLWVDIIRNNSIWAVSSAYFLDVATSKFCETFSSNLTNDSQQTEFIQYIRQNKMDLYQTARQMIHYTLIHDDPALLTLSEFCQFMARFGPEQCVLEKIHQLLCCNQVYQQWFRPKIQSFDLEKPITGSFSNTFSNAFIIKCNKITYHIYNLPYTNTSAGFLVDETCKKFLTWHSVFESINVAVPPQ